MSANQFGQLKQADFADNVGGINLVDSVFKIKESQAAGGMNFDYLLTGGFRKRFGAPKINSVADSALRSLGFGSLAPTSGASKSLIRAAVQKLQLLDTSTPSFTNLTQDTAATVTDAFAANSTQAVQTVQFSTGTSDILWNAGGGAALPVGAYSTTKFTANGVAAPSGTFTGAVNTNNSGSWTVGGAYYYALVWRKGSTLAISNAALDIVKTVVNTDDTVTLTIPAPTDTTLYDQVWVYRSAVSGVTGFTTGSLVVKLASSVTSFVDKGNLGNPDLLSAQIVPRADSTVLDNSVLPTGTYNTLVLWGHRLVTTTGNIISISDVNKSESWPTVNRITVPSAGPITALAKISFTSPQANSLQELLVVFKEKELWVVSPGDLSNYTTWTLLQIADAGCPQQSLVVSAQGYLSWINWRGVYLWDGTSKPIYCSRLLEPLFGKNGDLDKTKFSMGCGVFFNRENQIIWYLSSKLYGEQKFSIKMDLRLSLTQIEQNLTGRTIDAVLITDVHSFPTYAAFPYVPLNGQDEQLVMGDDSGFCYFGSNGYSDGGSDFDFRYLSAPLHCGNPNVKKQFHTVIAWVQDIGDWNLYLDYWSDYATSDDTKTTIGLPISTEPQNAALWDIASWDYSYWDTYSPNVIPIVFNLQAGNSNSSQGSALQVQFRNDNSNEPITVHGFSVIYSEIGGITA